MFSLIRWFRTSLPPAKRNRPTFPASLKVKTDRHGVASLTFNKVAAGANDYVATAPDMLRAYLHQLLPQNARPTGRERRRAPSPRFRPWVEALENRTVPSTYYQAFDGLGF